LTPRTRGVYATNGMLHMRVVSWLLAAVTIFIVVGHVCALPGHVHAVPAEHHDGDSPDHDSVHEASCQATSTSAVPTCAPMLPTVGVVEELGILPSLPSSAAAARTSTRTRARPPLFLLHAALLI